MTQPKHDFISYPGNHVRLDIDDADLDFLKAREIARDKAKEYGDDAMLLSWYQGKTGEYYPNVECGREDKPVWIVFAESRGGDLVIDINQEEYIFIFLTLV